MPATKDTHLPPTYIKNVAIEISQDYQMDNSPFGIERHQAKHDFIGKEALIRKFLQFLRDGRNMPGGGGGKGVFLVTGFRGMGKTSFVNEVLGRYKKETATNSMSPQNGHLNSVSVNGAGENNSSGDAAAVETEQTNTDNQKELSAKKVKSEKEKSRKKKRRIIPIHLTLTQTAPKEIDILRMVAISAFDELKKYRIKQTGYSGKVEEIQGKIKTEKNWILFTSICILLPLLLITKLTDFKNFITLDHSYITETAFALDRYKIIAAMLFVGGFLFFTVSLGRYLHLKRREYKEKRKVESPDNRIRWLVERCFTEITEENSLDEEIGLQGFFAKLNSPGKKRAKKYGLATVKEIEYELQKFLSLASRDRLEFIFIFDELDKVEPSTIHADMNNELEAFERNHKDGNFQYNLEDRKRAILNIISGLKNFFTTVDARFIFIAGHEMFDASLADIADRQSAVSSIFTYTFNIESLLRERKFDDGNDINASLSGGIEKLLIAILFKNKQEYTSNPKIRLAQLVDTAFAKKGPDGKFNAALSIEEKVQLHFILQNFITYLSYRGNGSPKKTIRIIHEFTEIRTDCFKAEEQKMTLVGFRTEKAMNNSSRKFLFFNFYVQYRIALLSYLYRPFMIQFGQSFKFQSDNIILSTPYLFDHLLKFHPFAFSLSNLELIPEMLSSNKTPSLKEHIKDIIEYLGANHIRSSEIGLFDYKFYSRTLNEISFISKMFDYESAAFNFTLDESHLVKLLINNKIKELRSIYSKFLSSTEDKWQQIFSIAHLNANLGDLHFFDQQFDDAVISYSDAIRPISHFNIEEMNMRDFVTMVKNKLKLGLCFEKINSFEEALAFYSDMCQDARRFLFYRITKCNQLDLGLHTKVTDINKAFFLNSSLSDVLQIVNQGFLAKIIIQEKMGLEGITIEKVSAAIGDFLKICLELPKFNGSRNNLVITNIFLMAGKLNYFKNSPCVIKNNDAVKNNLPSEVFDLLNGLSETYSDQFNNWPAASVIKKGIIRKPVMALFLYVLGLDEVFKSKQIEEKLIENKILRCSSDGSLAFLIIRFIRNYIYNAPEDQRFTALHYRYTASLLSNIGDCVLSMTENGGKTKFGIEDIFKLDKLLDVDKTISFVEYLTESPGSKKACIADVIQLYYLSAHCFIKAGKSVSASFLYRKILNLLRHVIRANTKNADHFISIIYKHVLQPILSIAGQNSGHSDIHMFRKAKDKIGQDVDPTFIFSNLSHNPEIREPILFFEYIKIRSGASTDIDSILQNIISPYHTITTQYVRIFELDFYAKYVYEKKLKESKEENHCVDYLFSSLSILKTIKMYGTDYMLGFSYCAEIHFRIAQFISSVTEQLKTAIKEQLDNLFEQGSYASLDHFYHYQMAKDFYEKAIQLHTTGAEYRKAIGNMIYLEDDFNDNAYHFGAAIDRFLMINNAFHNRIQECNAALNTNSYARSSNYVNWMAGNS